MLGTSQKQEWAQGLVGRTLGRRYQLQKLLGVGGMGAVYEARHQSMDRRVAVKVLLPTIAEDEGFVRRFEREARAAAKVAGPGVPQLFDLDVDVREGPFLVMEYLEGEGLDERLIREKTLPPDDAVALIVELLETLGPVHARGIVHRDLKPANIFLTKNDDDDGEHVKVLDFGIARLLFGPDSLAQLTQPGAAVGTPSYMAPEQLRGDPDVDGRADLYSVGIVLYQCLAGRLPHPQNSMQALIAAVITGMPVHLASVCPGLPESLVDAVHRALSVVPDQRFANADDMRKALLGMDLGDTGSVRHISTGMADPSAPTALAISTPAVQSVPPEAAKPSFSPPAAETRKGTSYVIPALIVAVVGLLLVVGAFGAAFGFVVTSDTREVPVTPVVAPQPVLPADHLTAAAPLEPSGWSPPHPMDVASPLPEPDADSGDAAEFGRVHEVVTTAQRLLDQDQIAQTETVLAGIAEMPLTGQTRAGQTAAIAFARLGDRLAESYGEDKSIPLQMVVTTLREQQSRVDDAYNHAAVFGSPRYLLCIQAKHAAFFLMGAHTLQTWPPNDEPGARADFAPIYDEVAETLVSTATTNLTSGLENAPPSTPEECRTAAATVLTAAGVAR